MERGTGWRRAREFAVANAPTLSCTWAASSIFTLFVLVLRILLWGVRGAEPPGTSRKSGGWQTSAVRSGDRSPQDKRASQSTAKQANLSSNLTDSSASRRQVWCSDQGSGHGPPESRPEPEIVEAGEAKPIGLQIPSPRSGARRFLRAQAFKLASSLSAFPASIPKTCTRPSEAGSPLLSWSFRKSSVSLRSSGTWARSTMKRERRK